ncbi:MBL fold metallo-hydrolase [Candidatus Microgenomates bacterium]|nr:MBL fold metallo-hydrolase [Candidatus Microgenomates bacterium]
MEITWVGQACFRLKGKTATVVTDPFDPKMIGLSLPKMTADIVSVSHEHGDHNNSGAVRGNELAPKILKGPGEYEVKGVSIHGVASWHDMTGGQERGKNTIFVVEVDGVRIVHLGDLGQEKLTEEQLAEIGDVDVLLIPVGGFYTIDAQAAVEIVAQIEPKVVIPMHYGVAGMNSELAVKLAPVDNFIKALGAVPKNMTTYQAKIETLPQEMELVILERKS